MPATDLERIAAFRASFARRQAAETTEVPGGVAVLTPEYAHSSEHNQIIIDDTAPPARLPALADSVLGHLAHRRISVLDDAVGAAVAPALTAAGYTHATELVMVRSGKAAAPDPRVRTVSLNDLRPATVRQYRSWLPDADDGVINQLADSRAARLGGAERVDFFAVRDENGTISAWADVYLEPDQGIAQLEGLITADHHSGRGYANAILSTAVHHAGDSALLFLVSDPDGWPQRWYARRGFTAIGRSHVFAWQG